MTEEIVLKELLTDKRYFSSVFQYLEKKDFQDPSNKKIFDIVGEIYKNYNKPPNIQEIELYSETKELSATDKTLIRSKFEEIRNIDQDIDHDIIVDTTEKWLKNSRFFEEVLIAGARVIDGESEQTREDIQKRAEEINKISFKGTGGLDYISDAEKNFLQYQEVHEGGIKSPLNIVNIATGDGHKPGTLLLYSSVSNGGKTVLLVNEAATAMIQGKNVAYFTFEETELEIRERLDGCLMNKNTSDFRDLGPTLKSSFDMMVNRGLGNCKIKAYGPRSASCLTVKAQLEDWKLKENFNPDIIILDSITIMAPIGKADNSYSVGKAVSEESKSLGVEMGVPIISAVQLGRQSYGASEVDMSSVSESIAIAQVATTMIGVVLDEHRPDTRLLSIIKSRKVNKSKIKAERVNIDTDRQKVWDMNEEEKKRLYVKSEEKEQIQMMNTVVEAAEQPNETGSSVLDNLFGR